MIESPIYQLLTMFDKLKAIKIDVEKREVHEVEIEQGLDALCRAIGCQFVDRVWLTEGNMLWVDDNGLLKEPQADKFGLIGYGNLLAGDGIILGSDEEGRSVSTTLTADFVRQRALWAGSQQVEPECGFMSFDDLADFADFINRKPFPTN